MHLLANLVAVVHIGYFLFIVLGTLAILCGPRLGWTWVRNLPFRLFHIAAVYVVLMDGLYWSTGVGLLVLLYLVPPDWRRRSHEVH
jgi:hypothetical protein